MRANTSSCAGRAGTLWHRPARACRFCRQNCKNCRQIVDKKATKRSNSVLTPPQGHTPSVLSPLLAVPTPPLVQGFCSNVRSQTLPGGGLVTVRRRAPGAPGWAFRDDSPGASDMPLACFAGRYTWLRPKAASLGVSDLGVILSPLREVEFALKSPTPRDAPAGRSHVYQRAVHATGISLAPEIVPKGPSRRARRPAAHRHQTPQSRLWEAFGGVSRGSIGQTEWSHRPFHTHT